MRTLRFDSVGGASGNMILAALTGLGIDPATIEAGLDTLGVGHFTLALTTRVDHGLEGRHLEVHPAHHEHQPHRNLEDIRNLVTRSTLPAPVRELSMQVFERLAVAEATVHGTTPDAVHFHEVGALDAIADIVGSCYALHSLNVRHVLLGPMPLAPGTIQTHHGTLPLPAPAVVELLKGMAVTNVDENTELVTPTGAALLVTWAKQFPATPSPESLTLVASANGLGSRTLNHRSNALRATLMEPAPVPETEPGACLVMECNLDDTVPELIGSCVNRLMENGALDAFTTAIQMKKQRPGTLLTVLCDPSRRDTLLDLIFRETTTFGVREHLTQRTMLKRRMITVTTPYGDIPVKQGLWKDGIVTQAPEHSDCVNAAQRHQVSIRLVYESALQAIARQSPVQPKG